MKKKNQCAPPAAKPFMELLVPDDMARKLKLAKRGWKLQEWKHKFPNRQLRAFFIAVTLIV